jgi:hypothetical protein
MLTAHGFMPSDAMFLMDWTECKHHWAKSHGHLSVLDKFKRLTNYLVSYQQYYDQNNNSESVSLSVSLTFNISLHIKCMIRDYTRSKYINKEYPSWDSRDCKWTLLEQAKTITPVRVMNAPSLQNMCVKKCVLSGIHLTDEYTMFRGDQYWWDKTDRVEESCDDDEVYEDTSSSDEFSDDD